MTVKLITLASFSLHFVFSKHVILVIVSMLILSCQALSMVFYYLKPDFFPLSRHLLVVFGGLQGLEASVDTDQNLDVTDPSVLFDFYLNTCPSQGSRTIRTEVRACMTCQLNWQALPDKIYFSNLYKQMLNSL